MIKRVALLRYSFALGCLIAATAADAQVPSRPIVIKKLPAPKRVLLGGTYVARPGKLNAAASKALLARSNALVKSRPKLIGAVMATTPGVARVNGAASGNFEPGGAYELTGSGFGSAKPAVFLLVGGRSITLDVLSYSDNQIFVGVPDSVSGFADFPHVTLNVGAPGKQVLSTTKFGFRAAREDVMLPVDRLLSTTAGSPASIKSDNGFFVVSRQAADGDGQKRCVTEGTDTIRWNPPLKPGFELSGYVWYHASDVPAGKPGGATSTPRGKYTLNFEGDVVRVGFAVMREYTPAYLALPGFGSCWSEYRLKLIATGPRGLPAF